MEKMKVIIAEEEVQKAVNEFKKFNENLVLKEVSGKTTICSGEEFDYEGVIKALDNINKFFIAFSKFVVSTGKNKKFSLVDLNNLVSVYKSVIYAEIYIRFEVLSEIARRKDSAAEITAKPEE